MNNKKILLVSGLMIILIGLIILVVLNEHSVPAPTTSQPANNQPAKIDASVIPNPTGTSTDKFRSEVPVGIKVPGANEVLSAAEKKIIAVPTVVTEAAPGVASKFKVFNISGVGGKFVPSQITINAGDTVHINFTAVDKDYDIVFPSNNMKQSAVAGGPAKILEFQALVSGSFLYYCDSCGGPAGPTTGRIIIVK